MKSLLIIGLTLLSYSISASQGNISQQANDHLNKAEKLEELSEPKSTGSFAVIPIPFEL